MFHYKLILSLLKLNNNDTCKIFHWKKRSKID